VFPCNYNINKITMNSLFNHKRQLSLSSNSSTKTAILTLIRKRVSIPKPRSRISKSTSDASFTIEDESISGEMATNIQKNNKKSKVKVIQERKFSSNTVAQYLSCLERFKSWLAEYNPDAMSLEDDNEIELPIMWCDIEPYFEEIITSNEENGEHQSTSKFNNIKSAIMYLHEQARVAMDPDTLREMYVFLDGYTKSENDWRVSGVIKATPGKFPLPFEAHVALCKIAIKYFSSGKDSYHLYSTLGWNLSTRSVNTGQLKYGHMRWSGDCIKMNICGGKTNQDGLQSFERYYL
jgi:hypothetical protein